MQEPDLHDSRRRLVLRLRSSLAAAALVIAIAAIVVTLAVSSEDDGAPDAPLRGAVYGFLEDSDTLAVPSEDAVSRAERYLAPFSTDGQPLVFAKAAILGSVEGLDVVVVPTEDAGRFCAAVMPGDGGDAPVSTLCTDARNAVHGLSIVEHQTQPGGLDAPRTYVGIAPDGVASVRALGRSVPVEGNVFGFHVAPGGPLGEVVYVLDDGTSARVRVTG